MHSLLQTKELLKHSAHLLLASLTLLPLLVNGQGTGVGIGTDTPDASAVLHIQSTTQGLLIPAGDRNDLIGVTGGGTDGLLMYDSVNTGSAISKIVTGCI